MSDNSYNGWANYETWCVNLWLDNDHDTYRDVLGLTNEHVDAYTYAHDAMEDVGTLARAIEDYVQCILLADAPAQGLVADLLGSAIGRVEWRDIAKDWLGANDMYARKLVEDQEEREAANG